MRFRATPGNILMIVALILFLLAAFGVALGNISLVALGLAFMAASFVLGAL